MIRSGFFNSVDGDRLYDANRFAEYFASFIGNGVFSEPASCLQIQVDSGMDVKIKEGKAWINGYILVNDADYIETIPSEAVLNRIDRYVVRLHFANREMTIVRKQGTASSSPVAPAVTRDANMYELSLALITIASGTSTLTTGMITDTRTDTDVCGYVSSTITTTPYLAPLRVIKSDESGKLSVSSVTDIELGYLSGVTSPLQAQINAKQATINGAASTIVSSNLTNNRALVSNGSGKVAVSTVTDTEIGYLSGVTSPLQTQINAKQATINGAASTIVSSNLTTNRALVSNPDGKVAVSAVTLSELEYLSGVTSPVQDQLNGKLGSTAQAADSLKVGGKKITVGTSAPTSPSTGDVWIDTN